MQVGSSSGIGGGGAAGPTMHAIEAERLVEGLTAFQLADVGSSPYVCFSVGRCFLPPVALFRFFWGFGFGFVVCVHVCFGGGFGTVEAAAMQ